MKTMLIAIGFGLFVLMGFTYLQYVLNNPTRGCTETHLYTDLQDYTCQDGRKFYIK